MEEADMERNGENLQINFHGNKLTLALDEIKYFEGRAMRVFVTMMDEHQISFDGNLDELWELLDGTHFVRCHPNYLVSCKAIVAVYPAHILLDNRLIAISPYYHELICSKVDELQRRKSNVIIAASEGVKTADGTYLCDLVSTAGQLDAFGHKAVLSGTSRYLSDLIHDKLNCKSRAIEFSTLQRCASHLASRTDVNEAYAVGGAAAAAAFAGETGRMIALKRISAYPYQCITESVDVQQVANLEKKVPLDWISPDGMQVTAAFEEYARPLILDEVTPVYVNGTPRHIRL